MAFLRCQAGSTALRLIFTRRHMQVMRLTHQNAAAAEICRHEEDIRCDPCQRAAHRQIPGNLRLP